jgi:hypothetical protein
LSQRTGKPELQAAAIDRLGEALESWKAYASSYTRQYVQPVLYNRAGVVDLPGQTNNLEQDIAIAKAWKPGTLADAKVEPEQPRRGKKSKP